MSKARAVQTNLAMTSTIVASSELTNRPASYLKNEARWKKWRSTTTTGDQNVEFTFAGGSQTIKVVAIVDYKKHGTTGTIKAEYWTGAAWALFGTFTLPSFNPTKVVAVWNTAGQATTKFRIYFTNVGAVSDYVELGVAVIGSYVEPTYNLVDGFTQDPVDPSIITAAVGGQESGEARTPYFVSTGQLIEMPDADRTAMLTLFAAVGQRTPFLFAIDPDNPEKILYCRFVEPLRVRHARPAPGGSYWNMDLSVQEVR
jgi:hypothetical protein